MHDPNSSIEANQENMTAAALAAMKQVLDLASNDKVLVLTDEITEACGQAFARAAEQHGCLVDTYILPQKNRPLSSVPEDLLAQIEETTVVINAIVGDANEIPFRLQWMQAIEACGHIRLGHSPGITPEMMSSGALNVDYQAMAQRAEVLDQLLNDAVSLEIETELGTKLVLGVAGRRFVHDLKASVEDGANLPCGEIFCCPEETRAQGTLVIDGCFGSAGTVPSPVIMKIKQGRVEEVHCEDGDTLQAVHKLMATDETSNIIAELGIGLNPGARMTENMLEAEKAHGTAHIAFGSNQGMPGGCNISTTHIDYLFTSPTITAVLADGSRRKVLVEGRLSRE